MTATLIQDKKNFFKNGLFRINLTYFEIENKILIPGHRFIPFLNPEINTNSITVYDKDRTLLAAETVSVSSERIKQYFSIFGLDNFLFLLIKDNKKNQDIIIRDSLEEKKFLVTAFSLEPLFKNIDSSKSKTVLEIKIDDWEKGIFTAEILTDPEDSGDAASWVENLEKGFFKAEEYKADSATLEEYLSTAFYLGGDYLIKNPAVTLEEFRGFSERDFISRYHSESVTSRILEKSKQDLNSKINSLIKTLNSIENRILSGQIKEDKENKITLEKISNTIGTLKSFSSELDKPDINEEKLNIIIKIINDSEKLTKI